MCPYFLGIWLDPSGVLGASPDGVVDGRLLEVKCPYSARDMTITQAVNALGRDFCLGIRFLLTVSVIYMLFL